MSSYDIRQLHPILLNLGYYRRFFVVIVVRSACFWIFHFLLDTKKDEGRVCNVIDTYRDIWQQNKNASLIDIWGRYLITPGYRLHVNLKQNFRYENSFSQKGSLKNLPSWYSINGTENGKKISPIFTSTQSKRQIIWMS